MKKELTWFQQSFEDGTIRYNIRYTRDERAPFGCDFLVSEDDLLRIAKSRKKKTWDEWDIIDYHGTQFAEIVTPMVPPVSP